MPITMLPLTERREQGMSDRPFRPSTLIPALSWIRTYTTKNVRLYLIAGLSLAAFVIPESLAYASLAQLPPVTGRLDAFQWKVPLAELADDTPLIEDRAPALETAAHTIARDEETPGATTPSSTPAPRLGIRPPVRPAGPLAEPVIPLLHVPDDPGSDQEFDAEPETEPQPGWRRFTSMFR